MLKFRWFLSLKTPNAGFSPANEFGGGSDMIKKPRHTLNKDDYSVPLFM